MLGSTAVCVDEKLVPHDRFDDLTTVDDTGLRERLQIKHTEAADQAVPLSTFTSDARRLRLDRVIASALADRDGPGIQARELSFRIVMRDAPPTDERLTTYLQPADPDPGPLFSGMGSVRMRFRADPLLDQPSGSTTGVLDDSAPFAFIYRGDTAVDQPDVEWFCDHLVVELAAPAASLDLTKPDVAERLLLRRVQNDVGAGMYPNAGRSVVDVAEAIIRSARAARQGSTQVTASELLRRTRLRSDFGAVARAYPVDKAIEVPRPTIVRDLVRNATDAADTGRIILLVAPPGQGKSWLCQQMIESLSDQEWIVAEHYCYLGDADGERLPRVHSESVFGSLLGRIAEYDPDVVSRQRPRYAAHEQALIRAVVASLKKEQNRRLALVVDGLDHVTRVISGGPKADPSFTLAEALASLRPPQGSALIVLSQPGRHLDPLKAAGAVTVQIPGLTESELRKLATQLSVISDGSDDTRLPGGLHPVAEERVVDEFVATLSARSDGNALYATYLCREVLRNPTSVANPSRTLCRLPSFDGSLRTYYEHIHASLGEEGAWVADVIALLDFPVSRSELKTISPDRAHRVDQAIDNLRPVLLERVPEGGVRVYHESFARFLRTPFQGDGRAKSALLDKIIGWLKEQGIYSDSRSFRHLVPILSEAGYNREVVDIVCRNFVVQAISVGFPASAIVHNIAVAIRSATSIGDWPATVRYVEMSRAAETYQEERFESEILSAVDVISDLLGADTLAERLLYKGRPVMSARMGLRMCSALDRMGAVPPWKEYMTAYYKEDRADNASYGEESDQDVAVALLRGRLRHAEMALGTYKESDGGLSQTGAGQDGIRKSDEVVNWAKLGRSLDAHPLPVADVLEATLDTFGRSGVVKLIRNISRRGSYCLAFAEMSAEDSDSEAKEYVLYWGAEAVKHGVPPGHMYRVINLGVEVGKYGRQGATANQDKLLELTRDMQGEQIMYQDTWKVSKWIDECSLAAINDPIGLSTAEALIDCAGWYSCWMRFVIALVVAEAGSCDDKPRLAVSALRILTEVKSPFLGSPRACDLYPIHVTIGDTIRRAFGLLDDRSWERSIEIVRSVSDAISTTLRGELGGPIPSDKLLHLVVDTATSTRRRAAQSILDSEIMNGGSRRYYADLAGYRLSAARLAWKFDDLSAARRHWQESCQLLIGYGWHKDVTIYELLDPLPALISVDPGRARKAVAKVQPLCLRVALHTDGKETSHAQSRWWELLAAADPCALSRLVQRRLLVACNDPNPMLHEARADLWRAWYHRADPIVAGAFRLTLEQPMEANDASAIDRIVDLRDGTTTDLSLSLIVALLSRADELPCEYSISNGEEFLKRDRGRVASLNTVAKRAGAPGIAALTTNTAESKDQSGPTGRESSSGSLESLPESGNMVFDSGLVGIAQAARAWQDLSHDMTRADQWVERFSNIIGYRLLELSDTRRETDADTAIRLVADARGFDESPRLLRALAEGLERHGQYSLATMAYVLTWTRARGRGGWRTFGGETEIGSLQRAARIDQTLALKTVGDEIERIVARGQATYGIGQALIYGFAKGGLGTSGSVPFEIWEEAFSVISDRIPRVAATDDPKDVYDAPDSDDEPNLLGELDVAFAAAAVAGLAHPGREQKRRSLVAVQILIDCRTSVIGAALETALSSLSDPATLTWLLRVIELAGDRAAPIVSMCRGALMELAGRPHLTVRALARRLLDCDEVPLAPAVQPDRELVGTGSMDLLLPNNATPTEEDTSELADLIEVLAGARLSSVETLLPGLSQAVIRRAETVLNTEEHKDRMRAQHRAYADTIRERLPNVFSAVSQAVEDAIQRSAAGARAARLMNAEPVDDPAKLEDQIASALLDDPHLPLALERTRQPRPEIPPPPSRGDLLWNALRTRAEGGAVSETGVEAAYQHDGYLHGTLSIRESKAVPKVSGPYSGWRLMAAVERREISKADWNDKEYDLAERYRVIELRRDGDRQALTVPPITEGRLQASRSTAAFRWSLSERIRTSPIVGLDYKLADLEDGRQGLGVQGDLLTPTPWLLDALKLKEGSGFLLDDDVGPALALITWRTEYDTSDYYLAGPRLYGSGLIVRGDLFEALAQSVDSQLVFRDYLTGPSSLCE